MVVLNLRNQLWDAVFERSDSPSSQRVVTKDVPSKSLPSSSSPDSEAARSTAARAVTTVLDFLQRHCPTAALSSKTTSTTITFASLRHDVVYRGDFAAVLDHASRLAQDHLVGSHYHNNNNASSPIADNDKIDAAVLAAHLLVQAWMALLRYRHLEYTASHSRWRDLCRQNGAAPSFWTKHPHNDTYDDTSSSSDEEDHPVRRNAVDREWIRAAAVAQECQAELLCESQRGLFQAQRWKTTVQSRQQLQQRLE